MVPTGWAVTRFQTCLSLVNAPVNLLQGLQKENTPGIIDKQEVETFAKQALEPFERTEGDNPFQVQYDLQEVMQDLVGIVRNEEELLRAMDELKKL